MINRALTIAAAVAMVLSLSACANTMRGVGHDMKQNTDAAVKATAAHP